MTKYYKVAWKTTVVEYRRDTMPFENLSKDLQAKILSGEAYTIDAGDVELLDEVANREVEETLSTETVEDRVILTVEEVDA